MKAAVPLGMKAEAEIKRVGNSGQISLGKQHAGQYFREDRLEDGSIVLTPVIVVPRSHWSVRDRVKIQKALDWAARHPARESDLDEVAAQAVRERTKNRRGG